MSTAGTKFISSMEMSFSLDGIKWRCIGLDNQSFSLVFSM